MLSGLALRGRRCGRFGRCYHFSLTSNCIALYWWHPAANICQSKQWTFKVMNKVPYYVASLSEFGATCSQMGSILQPSWHVMEMAEFYLKDSLFNLEVMELMISLGEHRKFQKVIGIKIGYKKLTEWYLDRFGLSQSILWNRIQ